MLEGWRGTYSPEPLRVTWQAGGMVIEYRIPTEDDWPDLVRADGRAFGYVPTQEQIDQRRPLIDLDRFRIAVDTGRPDGSTDGAGTSGPGIGPGIVGVAGSFAFDVTLPGGTTVPASGITWVGVSATHRRRGVVSELMSRLHAGADQRGEPVAMLFASEGGIYERFGYGVATTMRTVSIDRTSARLRPDLPVDRDAVRYVEGDAAHDHLAGMWDRHRRSRAGEISRNAVWHAQQHEVRMRPVDDLSPAFHLAHADGYAAYRFGEKWDGRPQSRIEVVEFVAVTEQAHLDLWHALLGVDLVVTIESRNLPSDEALPYLLADARPFGTTMLKDGMWANVLDPQVSFGARAYGSADRFVVEAGGQRWAIESDGTEASCRKVRSRPDIVTGASTLGTLLFGGVRPSLLARGRRLSGRTDDVLRRADAFFVVGPAPHCSTWF